MVVPFRTVDELFAVLAADVIDDGEHISHLDHHLQCAAVLRADAPADIELQVAGLVHDVASVLTPRPAGDHALVGAELVRPLLGDRVADLVSGHVEAKRYLVTTEPSYREILSENSTATLARQGDVLDPDDLAAFEASPHAADWVRLRRADDQAKVYGRPVPDLESWRPVVMALSGTAQGAR